MTRVSVERVVNVLQRPRQSFDEMDDRLGKPGDVGRFPRAIQGSGVEGRVAKKPNNVRCIPARSPGCVPSTDRSSRSQLLDGGYRNEHPSTELHRPEVTSCDQPVGVRPRNAQHRGCSCDADEQRVGSGAARRRQRRVGHGSLLSRHLAGRPLPESRQGPSAGRREVRLTPSITQDGGRHTDRWLGHRHREDRCTGCRSPL